MKFRKKPVVIEAFQIPVDGDVRRQNPPTWAVDAVMRGELVPRADGSLMVKTLEDGNEEVRHADAGDWIIRGVKGDLYPCKQDIFAATYEPAE